MKDRYNGIEKARELEIPEDKKVLDTLGLAILALADRSMLWESDLKKKIKSIPDEVLSKGDKDARLRTIWKRWVGFRKSETGFDLGSIRVIIRVLKKNLNEGEKKIIVDYVFG